MLLSCIGSDSRLIREQDPLKQGLKLEWTPSYIYYSANS
mgnify:CR=1 FL=1